MAAACFPEEQAKVQAELNAVIGRHRGSSIPLFSIQLSDLSNKVPSFADQESLPRLEAFISEALRWRPVAPNG
jgi:cytochrome P450